MPLPDWNDLSDDIRSGLCDFAHEQACDECVHIASDLALAFYNRLKTLYPGETGALIPPKQREAAALLLSAIDLPAEASAWGRQLMEAASIAPGVTAVPLFINSRRAALQRARDIIDDLLSEAS